MLRWFWLAAIATAHLSGCSSFYRTAPEGAPAAVVTESHERRELFWYQQFALAEVDEQPVSHFGTDLGKASVRLVPGKRKLLIEVSFLHGKTVGSFLSGGYGDCTCVAYFPVVVEVAAGDHLRIEGRITEDRNVSIWLADANTGTILSSELSQLARPVPKTMYVPAGNSYVPISPAK